MICHPREAGDHGGAEVDVTHGCWAGGPVDSRFRGNDGLPRPMEYQGEGEGGYPSRWMAQPAGAWQVGSISMRLILTWAGCDAAQNTDSAMSSAVSGWVPR